MTKFTAINIILFTGALTSINAQGIAEISVLSGDFDRINTPVSIQLTDDIIQNAPFKLIETTGGQSRETPYRMETGPSDLLWWIMEGATSRGAARTYILEKGDPAPAEQIANNAGPISLKVFRGEDTVLHYNHSPVPAPAYVGDDNNRNRTGYIHPLLSPSGEMVTEDYPADHHHHRGLFFSWVMTEYRNQERDLWNLITNEGTVRFKSFRSVDSAGAVYSGFRAEQEHVIFPSNEVALDEIWDVRVWNTPPDPQEHWLWDLTSIQTVREEPFKILQFYYAGLGYRGAQGWRNAADITTSEGVDSNGTRADWAAITGDVNGKTLSTVILSHPQNINGREPVMSFENLAFTGFNPVYGSERIMDPLSSHVFKYRFYVTEGKYDSARAVRYWNDFAYPPDITLKTAAPLIEKKNRSDRIHLQLPGRILKIQSDGDYFLGVYSLKGEKLWNTSGQKQNTEVHLPPHLQPGLYLLVFKTDEILQVRPVF